VVFALMHERLPAKEIEDAASQLPRDLQELWRAPAAGGRA